MTDLRRLAARGANVGLVLFGLAVVTILGTGGTQFRFLGLDIGMHSLANPVQGLFFFAALRLLVSRQGGGLEGKLIRFYGRHGLAPRHAPATLVSGAVSGALIGAGFGAILAAADVTRLFARSPHPAPKWLEWLAILGVDLAVSLVLMACVGAVVGFLLVAGAGLFTRTIGRYRAGRAVVAVLLLLAPLAVRSAPSLGTGAQRPTTLLAVSASILVTALVVFVLLPAAYLRARRGRWGLAVIGGGSLAILVSLGALGAVGTVVREAGVKSSSHPNILVVSITGLRADAIGVYGGAIASTPTLDELGGQGLVFESAVTPSTDSGAAAASLLTGLYPASHGIRGSGQHGRLLPDSLPELLAAHGYRTGAFVSSSNLDGAQTGLAEVFDSYEDLTSLRDWLERLAVAGGVVRALPWPAEDTRDAGNTVDAFRRWVARRQSGPWLAWVQLADVTRPRPVREADEIDADPIPLAPSWASPSEQGASLRSWLAGYQRTIADADAALREMRELLRTLGMLPHTITVVVAEHGVALGEGGAWFETGTALPEGVLHVPWLIAGPGVTGSGRVAGPASLVDVTPTLLGLLGLGTARQCEGEDLSRYLLRDAGEERSVNVGPVFSESSAGPSFQGSQLHAVRYGTWKLVRYPDGSERLYLVQGVEQEMPPFRGQRERIHQEVSDMLTRRLAQEARWQP